MKFARIEGKGDPEFAIQVAGDNTWIPFSQFGLTANTTAEAIAQASVVRERLPDHQEHAAIAGPGTKLRCPVVSPGKILAIGLNYLDHIRETGATQPERPIVFAKYPSSLNDPQGNIESDRSLTEQLDYEAELAVVMGRQGRRLTPENALSHVFGYAVANDVSARDWQRIDSQFSRSKSYDTFCPIGPWITSADEVPDPQKLDVRSTVNGELRQNSNTSEMLFSVRDLIVFLSQTMTLHPGDVILTGTPPGVGLGRKPPVFLEPGDVVMCEVGGLGQITNRVVESLAPVEDHGG